MCTCGNSCKEAWFLRKPPTLSRRLSCAAHGSAELFACGLFLAFIVLVVILFENVKNFSQKLAPRECKVSVTKENWKRFLPSSLLKILRGIIYSTILMANEGMLQFGSHFTIINSKDDSIRYLDVTNLAPSLGAEIYVKSLLCPFSQQGPRMPQQQRLK